MNSLKLALYLVPTPIGNLEDITLRAINVLQNVNVIACEDTRRTGVLLKSLNINNKTAKLVSYFEHNETERSNYLINEIISGKTVAIVSDAGTPCISDPGYKIVVNAIKHNVPVVPLPGATAFVPALISSGFAVHNFTFFGFPPQKKGRQTFINNVLNCQNTAILYESSHKILKLLNEISTAATLAGKVRNMCVSREISKIYEENLRFSTEDFLAGKIDITAKGEFVVVLQAV